MNRVEKICHWVKSSDDDYKTMKDLFETGNFAWSLFIGHLVIEKLLKAYYIKNVDERFPLIHDLNKIAIKAKLEITEERKLFLNTVTTFNIETRYEDYKKEFSKKCNKEFSSTWVEKIEEFRLWIKEML